MRFHHTHTQAVVSSHVANLYFKLQSQSTMLLSRPSISPSTYTLCERRVSVSPTQFESTHPQRLSVVVLEHLKRYIFRCSSTTTNPVCEGRVNILVYSLSLHRHSYIGFILAFASSIHNKQTVCEACRFLSFGFYARRVDFSDLVFSLSSHRHSYVGLVFNSGFHDS